MSHPTNDPDTTASSEAVAARRALLREVGDRAAASRQLQHTATADASVAQREAEQKAHAAGIAWKDIDSARVTGLLNRNWPDIRDAPDLDDKIRDYLLTCVHTEIGLLRNMIAVDALLDQTRRGEVVTFEQIAEFEQHQRNLGAVHGHIENLAALIGPTGAQAAAIRGRLLEDWGSTIAATTRSVGTGAGLDEAWWHHAAPRHETRTHQVTSTLRHRPAAAQPLLPPLEHAVTAARNAAHAQLNPVPPQTAGSAPAAAATTSVGDAVTAVLPAHRTAALETGLGQGVSAPVQSPAIAPEGGTQL